MTRFVDRVVLHLRAGNGGHGVASIHREKFKPLGGPDGGNGGRGGDILLVVDPNAHTLLDFHHHPHQSAPNGAPGAGSNRNGAEGADLELRVPDGTVVLDGRGEVLADLTGAGTRFVAARGGRGGLGNAALASPRRKAPGFALLGEPGEARDVVLELKSVADVGLVGFPSAGKSSLIAAMSAARPKIADYPFTTLVPNLGVTEAGDVQFVIADVPGLIPGASEGRGLGHAFLRHVERCSALLHVIDCATEEPGRDPVADLDVIEAELSAYGAATGTDLRDRPRLVALNKIDVPAAKERADRAEAVLAARGLPVFQVSAATRDGLRELGFGLAELVAAARAAAPSPQPTRRIIRPAPAAGPEFEIVRTPEGAYLVRGEKPRRWVRQTDFSNDEAVGYLADRLARLGVEEALGEAGAEPGDEILIGDPDDPVVFDWDPTVSMGDGRAQTGSRGSRGPRGTDRRISG